MLTIADRIKYFRKQRGLTQAQLAAMTGIHPVSIRKYETNKMQPQSAQIERIAEALQVNSGAISGSHSEIIRLETVGDLMGLLMVWHKSGILQIEGERGEDKILKPDTVHLVPNPVLGNYFAFFSQDKKEEAIQMDSLKLKLSDQMLSNLLRWEYLYNGYLQMSVKYAEPENDAIRTAMDEFVEDLERIEMELQGSMEQLI